MTESLFRRLLLRFALVPAVALCLFLTILGFRLHRISVYRTITAEATATLLASNHLAETMIDQESGIRGYALTHDPKYLDPYRAAANRLEGELSTLVAVVNGDPEEGARVTNITRNFRDFDRINQQLLQPGVSAEQIVALLSEQKSAMDRLRVEFAGLSAIENGYRDLGRRAVNDLFDTLPVLGIGLGVLVAGLLIWHGIFMFREITTAFRSQLAESEAQRDSLHTTLQSIGDAVIVCDRSGRITLLNPTAEELTGWSMSLALGQPLDKVFHMIDETTRIRLASPITYLGRPGSAAKAASNPLLIRQDGAEIPIDERGAPIRAGRGDLIGIVLVFRSIAERKLAQDALRASEERLRIATETARLGTWELDLRSGHMEASSICREHFGRSPNDQFTYQDLLQSVYPDDRQRREAAVQRAIEQDAVYRLEYRTEWPDGSLHWILASGRALRDAEGMDVRMLGVTMDVTERRQAEAALLQSEKLAAVGRLAATIAHEINNPLESVTNLLYLARIGRNVTEIHAHLDLAERELRRVSVITTQTLRFHKQSTRPRPVTAAELFESVLLIYQGRLSSDRVALQQRERGHSAVLCSDGEIRQVLNNLVGNALDAIEPRGGSLFLRSREGTDWKTGRKGIVVTIGDTGGGIPRKTIQKIFDPFFTTKGASGTGLGLWVSKEIVDRHEGSLRVRSQPQPGASWTVFTLFLPFVS